jgi:hypothetical protein
MALQHQRHHVDHDNFVVDDAHLRQPASRVFVHAGGWSMHHCAKGATMSAATS